MLARLAAKTVAVTGGCSGIGLAVAKRCALAGARRIFIGDLTGGTSACISAVQHEFQQLGLNKTFDELVKISSVDVTNPASVDCWIRSIIEETGGLDLAANIAGLAQSAYSRPSPAILHENDEEWARVLGVNLTGIFYCTKAEINAMMLGQRGRDSGRSTVVSEVENCNMSESSVCHRCSIVNMASLTACYPLADIYAYGSSKAAVKHFTSSVARDVWKHGIRVNAVSPAATDTPMIPVFLPQGAAETHRNILNLLSPNDVADVVVWLLSDEAKLISGTNIPIGFRDV